MRILLFGKGGQLGWEARRTLACLGDVTALDYPEVDFTRPDSLGQVVKDNHPDVIFNAAAYTAVDRAEQEPEKARSINAITPGVLAEAAKQARALMIHVSTDYVFDGQKGSAYIETDAAKPLNVYGQSKLEGEVAVEEAGGPYLILRTSWVYSRRPESFTGKVLSWARSQKTIKVVSDQIGSPTWARLLAEASAGMLVLAQKDVYSWGQSHQGLYHLAGDGAVSRYDWARAILALDPRQDEHMCVDVIAAQTTDFPTPARRPLATALDCSKFYKTFGLRLGDWRQGLKLALE